MGLFSKLIKPGTNKALLDGQNGKKDLNFGQFFDDLYYPHAESTRKRPIVVKQTFDKHMRKQLGHLQFFQIDTAVLDGWVRDQIRLGYKFSTINKHIFLINRLLNLSRRWGYIDQLTFENLTIKRLPLGDYKQRFLSVPEIASVLKSAEQDQHPFMFQILKLLILTGARSSEARLARWRDMDLHARIWTVPISKNGRARRIVLESGPINLFDRRLAT